jgi:hypothetical protein
MKTMKRDRKCPNCEWKYPIFSPPVKRKEGNEFNCPKCEIPLVYHTGLGKKSTLVTGAILALYAPTFLFMMIDDDRALQIKLFLPILVVGLFAFWYFISLEYLVRDKNNSD